MLIESTFDLSDEEYKRVQMHAEKLFSLWTDTGDSDEQVVEAALIRVFARERLPQPYIFWCDSLQQLHTIPTYLDTLNDEAVNFGSTCVPADPITQAFNRALSKANLTWPPAWQQRVMQIVGAHRCAQWREACARAQLLMMSELNAADAPGLRVAWGRWAADLLPVYATPALALASGDWGEELLSQLADLSALRGGAFAYVFRHSSVFVCRNPIKVNLDSFNRLHNDDGPAVEFADGQAIYAWAGVRIDPELILDPATLTVERIDSEPNVELRRVMIEKFGVARYLTESGAVVIAEDECGSLLLKEVEDDEPIMMVRVINSTAEPDGSFKEYFLRVPPHMVSPREAVAWTFGLNPEEYEPQLQT